MNRATKRFVDYFSFNCKAIVDLSKTEPTPTMEKLRKNERAVKIVSPEEDYEEMTKYFEKVAIINKMEEESREKRKQFDSNIKQICKRI